MSNQENNETQVDEQIQGSQPQPQRSRYNRKQGDLRGFLVV